MAITDKQPKGRRDAKASGPSDPSSSKPKSSNAEPRPTPNFISSLRDEETDFPRGGGSSLTPLEMKQTYAEGRREADQDVAKEAGQGVKRRRQTSEREAKRLKRAEVQEKNKERDKDNIRVEELNYKRLVPGTNLLTRVHTILPLHLILSLPNNLLAHVPITEISNTLTTLLTKEEESDSENEDEDEAMSTSDKSDAAAPDLTQLFQPGQYLPAKVVTLFPSASQSFISQYPVTETTRLAARLEVTLIPAKVNSELVKNDVEKGLLLVGEVLSEEDNGWRVGLGLSEDEGNLEGWVSHEEAEKHLPTKTLIPGQLLPSTIASSKAGGRVFDLSLDPAVFLKSQLSEVSNVASILPGHLVSVLVTAVVPSGLNVKVCGFFDGTIDLAHLALGGEDIDDKYKVGKKIRARIIYDNLATTPRHFSLSVLPHILALTSPTTPNSDVPLETAISIGKVLSSVKITRVIGEWGVMCRTDDGLEGFVHISHISDDRVPALSGSTGQYRVGTLHRARVIGHSPLDGILLLSFEQKVLDQVFMNVDELRVGQSLKGTIKRLTDKALFVNINGSVDGVVWPLHYADIRLKHPEKRFKVGGTVKAKVFALEPTRSRIILTLKKSIVESDLPTPAIFEDVTGGMILDAVVSKILDKGCIVDLFGGLRAFIPQSEASQNFIANLSDIFFVGKPVKVRITEIDSASRKLVASVRQALPTALAAADLAVGDGVSGLVSQVHKEQVVVSLIPSQLTALLSLSNLSNHRHVGIDELRSSLKIGERLDELVVLSKNSTSGIFIVGNKRKPSEAQPPKASVSSGVSKGAQSIDAIKSGQILSGIVISHTPQGAMVQLSPNVRGRVHPCDAVDDLTLIGDGEGPLNVDEKVDCYVLNSNPFTRIVDLSTRPSRVTPDQAGVIVDPEIGSLEELKIGQKVRGLVKNVADHGVFVSIGRSTTARVMIKELFDEYVKDWKAKFQVNQLVSGTIKSIDKEKKLVELSLRSGEPAKGAKKAAKRGLGEFEVGQKVDATVSKVEAYGMFLRIEGSDVSGLCHKSEISDNKKTNVAKALRGFREGDSVKAVIIELNPEKKRINFSIKPSLFDDEFANKEDGIEDGSEDGEDDEGGEGAEDEDGDEHEEDEEEDEDMEDDEEEEVEDEEDGEDDGDEIDDEDDEEEDVEKPSSSAPKASSKAKNGKVAPTPILSVSGGFNWSGDSASDASSSASDSEDEGAPVPSKSRKGKQKALDDLTSTAPDAVPESATDYERALLASPNSSYLWIQYMSFNLQLHEIDKARKIGRQALEKIGFREEEEKLNVWMALVNLEIGFGTAETIEKVFKEAVQYNDAKTVYLRYAEALTAAGKEQLVDDVWKKATKKFSAYTEVWTKAAEWYYKKGDVESARDLLPRSMKSLDKSKHVETIEKIAVLEFRYADAERGKTLMEELVDRYPKRLDLWNVYIDQLTKAEDIQAVRGLFDRALGQKLTAKRAKFLFKKWLGIETKIGDVAGQDKAKARAREWVVANTQVEEQADEEEEESDEE